MALEAGKQLGPYRIVGPAGAGGMGEVYVATDTRLDRQVAIKVLPEHLSQNEELRQRFDREAKTISNLSHPNICALFDVGHEEGIDYLVMEYLEGETLARRIEREPLAPEEVLRIGIQISDALETAHRSGIIHRDLKPGNVMMTRSGAKLLDFGLAKLADSSSDVVNSTLTAMATRPHSAEPLTGAGTILGTFQYMAPEQLEGRDTDARADVFALGAMLYEMATGRKAFEGASQASLIAAILERTPAPISTIRPMTPPALDHVVRACMAKDPDERVQTAHDVRLQLQWILEGGSQAGVPAPVMAHRRRAGRLAWVLAAVFAAVSVALGAMWMTRKSAPAPVVRATVLAPEGVDAWIRFWGGSYSVSPDGMRLAFSASTEAGFMLWVRDMASGEARALTGTERGSFPFWSPDGRQIGFFAGGKLRSVGAEGGSAVTICDAENGRGGTWNADGVIVFSNSTGEGLFRVSAGGGTPVAITSPDTTAGEEDNRFPWFLPDGRHFVFTGRGQRDAALYVGSLDGGTVKRLLAIRSNAQYAGGRLWYVRDNTLVAQPFDTGSLEFTGDADIVAEPVARNDGYAHGSFSVSRNGVLVYGEEGSAASSSILEYDDHGSQIEKIDGESTLDDLVMSRDGKSLAMSRYDEGSGGNIWTYDIGRAVFTRVTFDDASDDPLWSPDGKFIAYSTGDIYRRRSSGAGESELLFKSPADDLPVSWSADGKEILFLSINSETAEDIWVLPLAGGEAHPILNTKFREMMPQFSPDGRWIAYVSNESGNRQVYLLDYPGLTDKVQVSPAGGTMPRWRADGRELYYVTDQDSLTAVALTTAGDQVRVGRPRALFHADVNASSRTHLYAVSPDGKRFYMLDYENAAGNDRFTVLVGWKAAPGR